MPQREMTFQLPGQATRTVSLPAISPQNVTLPPLDQIWPLVTNSYTQLLLTGKALLINSSPQAQSDWSLGFAVMEVYQIYFPNSAPGSPLWQQSLELFNAVINNVNNIGQLTPSPASQDSSVVAQWVAQEMPDFSEADLFPPSPGPSGIGIFLLWGMACRALLISAGWDLSGITASTDRPTLYVNGRFLFDRKRNQIILRGVNYPLLDDYNFPANPTGYLNEIAKTGANAIRIQWYINYSDPNRPAYPMTALATFLDSCIAADIIPILMISDETSQSDMSLLNSTVIPWWTHSDPDPAKDVIGVLKPRAQHLILNLANELGLYHWADDPTTALAQYISAYQTAIKSMRAAGLYMPLMIDAPDGGTALDAFTSQGAALVSTTPLGNILLSAHAYWAASDGRPFIAPAMAANLPIVFGEIANKEDNPDDSGPNWCYFDLDGTGQNNPPPTGFTYQSFLQTLLTDKLGWLAWAWTDDQCSSRQLSSNGSFSALGAYGNDIVNNGTYGLKATAVRVKSW